MIVITRTYPSATVTQNESIPDVISSIYCVCTGIDEATGIQDSAGETILLDSINPVDFIPFDQLTLEVVDSWIINKPQYVDLEAKVRLGVESKIAPAIVTKPLPFSE